MTTPAPYLSSDGRFTTATPQALAQYKGLSKAPASPSTSKTPSPVRKYSRKRILLVWFQNHDFDQAALNKELGAVVDMFSNRLGFDEYRYCTIADTGTSPTEQLITSLKSFTKSCQQDQNQLLVVYYSGHGGARQKGRGGLQLVPQSNSESAKQIYWNRIQRDVLFEANADILVLLDCCQAEMGVKGLHQYRRDAMAACASSKTSDPPEETSFTACLIDAADQLLRHGEGFTVRQLFRQIAAVASQKWNHGGRRAEVPIYKDQCGDQTNHEIYFEGPPPPDESDEGSGSGDSDDEDEEDDNKTAPARDSSWQQRRTQAQNAYRRMRAQGYTSEQAFASLVKTLREYSGISQRDAEVQTRQLLA